MQVRYSTILSPLRHLLKVAPENVGNWEENGNKDVEKLSKILVVPKTEEIKNWSSGPCKVLPSLQVIG